MAHDLQQKLEILADAAKYDASCASSGGQRRSSAGAGKGLGSITGSGICHSYTPDGRCISLLKILLTNACIYDCHYCINRRSSNTPRARFTAEEVVELTLNFYKRNYIEGLFLSSGIIRTPDYTMEQVVRVAKLLRTEHHFRGYIHLKTIPEASPELIDEAGRYADRISVNVELPSQQSLEKFAPEKNLRRIQGTMANIRTRLEDQRDKQRSAKTERQQTALKKDPYLLSGQSTQMIIGADDAKDRGILSRADTMYKSYRLKRVYYSAYSPIPDSSSILPAKAPPLVREHRLYQADWLLRNYGFELEEIVPPEAPELPLNVDPKTAWALRHPEYFPVVLNRAPREMLLRVPGLGVKSVERILRARRFTTLRAGDLTCLHVSLKTVLPWIETPDHRPGKFELTTQRLQAKVSAHNIEQMALPLG